MSLIFRGKMAQDEERKMIRRLSFNQGDLIFQDKTFSCPHAN